MLKKLSKHELSILKHELLDNLMLYPDGLRVFFDERYGMYKISFLKKDALKARQLDVDLLTKDDVDTKALQRQLEEYFIKTEPKGTEVVETKVGGDAGGNLD